MSTNTPTTQEGTDDEHNPHDDAVILDDGDADPWKGPFKERDKYGQLTGAAYLRCRACGVEALTGRKDAVRHREGCPHREE